MDFSTKELEDNLCSFQENISGQDLDLEPQLEFDDTELEDGLDTTRHSVGDDCEDSAEDLAQQYLRSEDEHLEEALEEALGAEGEGDDNWADIARHGVVEVVGDDLFARKVITIYACRLPDDQTLNWRRFLRYLLHTLDTFVESDYTLVYFHFGLHSRNKPSIRWLWTAFRAFDRKYKKNLKALLLVHPTSFVRLLFNVFRPVISAKFGRKIHYISHLEELQAFLHFKQLFLPKQLLDHDRKVAKRSRQSVSTTAGAQIPNTQQFRVSLQFLKANNAMDAVPRVVRTCVAFLDNERALQTEGLFRRSANASTVRELQTRFNAGQEVDFEAFADEDSGVHVAAALLKSFLRELEEPLL
ncbi:unnamed protein product, partial [Medioppia subpectinata]